MSPFIPNTQISHHNSALISEVVVGAGGAATIDFSNIPQNGSLLRILASLVHESLGQGNIAVRFNGDSGSNYASQITTAVQTSITASQDVGQTSAVIGKYGQVAVGVTAYTICEIPFYTDINFKKFGSSVSLSQGDDLELHN